MHKILIFGRESCEFTKKAIDSIKNNCIFIPTGENYDHIDEPFRSIIKKKRHVTSPCIFRIKYLGGNKDLIELHNRRGQKQLSQNDYVIFGRDSCPYTIDSLDKMDKWGLYYQYVQVNSIPNQKMAEYYFEIAISLRHKTAPCIFTIQFIGTCSNLIKLNEKMRQKEMTNARKHQKAVEYVEELNSE